MASEDVIELGSSEDEAEPAPKKKKPMPNAMVHIPTKLPGLTIKPAKLNLSSVSKTSSNISKVYNGPKGVLSRPIVISNSFPTYVKPKSNSTPLHVPILGNIPKITKMVSTNANKYSINPMSLAKNLKKPDLVIKKVASNRRPKNPIERQGPRLLNNLPPGITIKPLAQLNASASGVHKKRKINALKHSVGDFLTVEIDDEEGAGSSKGSPQWYLRPEEQEDVNDKTKDEELTKPNDKIEVSMEEENNKEPEIPNFVEITIEDSPVKSLQLKNRSEIGKELAITIEDSPVKPIKDKEADSDNEQSVERVPHSKKKLNYPKNENTERQVVEIEIDLNESETSNYNQNMDLSSEQVEVSISNQDELIKTPDNEKTMAKKDSNIINESKNESIDSEFHPVYQDFIALCFKLENSDDMKKIVEKKIKAYYKQCPKEYVESDEFIEMVASKITLMKTGPEKMYLYIKDVVDELNLLRKMPKTTPSKTDDTMQESEKYVFGEECEYDSKRQRQIRKLEKTIKKLHRAIQKLEEQEVDFDDDEDSVYLLTERYKERMVRVHAKFCQLINTKMPSEPRIHLEVRPGRPAGPVRKLEKWVNRKVPIGTPLPFPDFHDVLKCVREANDDDKLGWNEVDIMEEARDLFTRCGKKLQRRRQENEWRLAVSRISHHTDPAESNVELKKKLDENKSCASKREVEILNKYVDRQNQLKLVAEEIGDKEAEESPVESEEEDISEDVNPLLNKQQRKERLKRLLHEKNRKAEEKENEPQENKSVTKVSNDENFEQSKPIESEIQSQDDNSDKIDIVINDAQVPVDDCVTENEDEDKKENTDDKKYKSDGNEFESDIDELNLLQKLHSGNETDASTIDSSDYDTPIAISDTLESDSDAENKNYLSDVISIENSSYSESEATVDGMSKDIENNCKKGSEIENFVSDALKIEYCAKTLERAQNENIVENILLASSDDESLNKVDYNETCINLKDDDISISETTIDGEKDDPEYNDPTAIGEDLVESVNTPLFNKQEHEKDNNSITSVMDCSEINETAYLSKVPYDSMERTSVGNSDNVDMETDQNNDTVTTSQTESHKNTCNLELSEKSEKVDGEIIESRGLSVDTETVNNNMEQNNT